jgi:hypothetical protein
VGQRMDHQAQGHVLLKHWIELTDKLVLAWMKNASVNCQLSLNYRHFTRIRGSRRN